MWNGEDQEAVLVEVQKWLSRGDICFSSDKGVDFFVFLISSSVLENLLFSGVQFMSGYSKNIKILKDYKFNKSPIKVQ